MRSFDDLLNAVQGGSVKLTDLLDLDRDIGKFPPSQQRELVLASFQHFMALSPRYESTLGIFARNCVRRAQEDPDATFRADVLQFGCKALVRTAQETGSWIGMFKDLFTLAGEDRAQQEAVLSAGVQSVYGLQHGEDSILAVSLAQDVFSRACEHPEQRAAALEAALTVFPALVALHRDNPEMAEAPFLLSGILSHLQPTAEDAPLLAQVTNPALSVVTTCVPDPTYTPDPESARFAFTLLAAHGVGLKDGEGFCCADFLLAARHPDLKGRAVVALIPAASSQKRRLGMACARSSLAFYAEGRGKAPMPPYYNDILAVVDAVAGGTVTPLPFSEAVAVHKRGGSTWPRVANN